MSECRRAGMKWVCAVYRRAGMKCQSVGGQAWNVRAMSAAAYDRISVT